jgi:hypothetical protein
MARPPAKKGAPRKGQSVPRVKRPQQIPVRDWRKLSPATKQRYARYLAKHPRAPWTTETRQRARGHRKGEAAQRRSRWEERAYAFAEKQAIRWPGTDVGALAEEHFKAINERRKRFGESDLAKLEAVVTRLEERRSRQPLGERGRPERFMTTVDMEGLGDSYDVPYTVFGYH